MGDPDFPGFPGFDRVAVIGLGLIGGSVALGLKRRGLAGRIVSFDRSGESLAAGLSLGVVDETFDSVAAAARGADLVLLAVPVQAMSGALQALAELDLGETVITDVGSVKSAVIDAARTAWGEAPRTFVPGHPIAGSEQHGVGAARDDLFENHRVILTPPATTSADALGKVRSLWRGIGAEVVEMDAAHHDDVLARTSHLPHLLAYALVDTLSRQGDSLEIFQYAAGGFRDFSRIAASDPVMWRDIFDANSGKVLEILDEYLDELAALKSLIRDGDGDGLQAVLARAKAARDHFSALDASRREGKGK